MILSQWRPNKILLEFKICKQFQLNPKFQRKLQPIGVTMRGVHAVRKGDTHCNIFFYKNFASLGI